jgi:hypothetical protein
LSGVKAPPQFRTTFQPGQLTAPGLLRGEGRVVRAGALRAVALSAALSCLLPAVAARGEALPAQTQTQAVFKIKPVTGFITPYEITRTVIKAGFHPLVRPLREGTVYVLRATDSRGIVMRVELDAGTGRIRDVSRLEGEGAELGPAPPADAVPADGPPAKIDAPSPSVEPTEPIGLSGRSSLGTLTLPPLPRPRPAAAMAQDLRFAHTSRHVRTEHRFGTRHARAGFSTRDGRGRRLPASSSNE